MAFNFSFAQQNELDEQYTPKGNQLFSGDSKSSRSSYDYSDEAPLNVIKIHPFSLFRSLFLVGYERNLSEYFSLEAGIGFNYNKDRLYALVASEFSVNDTRQSNYVRLYDAYQNSNHYEPKISFYFCPKVMFDTYNGTSYIQLMYKRYTNNLYYDVSKDNSFVMNNNSPNSGYKYVFSGKKDFNVIHNLFMIVYGFQFNTSGKIATTHEVYTGFGLRELKYNPIQITEFRDSYTNNTTTTYTVSGQMESAMTFVLNVGYSFGIGWGKRK